jgi:hypothetical protein
MVNTKNITPKTHFPTNEIFVKNGMLAIEVAQIIVLPKVNQ